MAKQLIIVMISPTGKVDLQVQQGTPEGAEQALNNIVMGLERQRREDSRAGADRDAPPRRHRDGGTAASTPCRPRRRIRTLGKHR